nr:hypothetical protein [Haladaptatus sp. R4]
MHPNDVQAVRRLDPLIQFLGPPSDALFRLDDAVVAELRPGTADCTARERAGVGLIVACERFVDQFVGAVAGTWEIRKF